MKRRSATLPCGCFVQVQGDGRFSCNSSVMVRYCTSDCTQSLATINRLKAEVKYVEPKE
jgi:hypothetical protein